MALIQCPKCGKQISDKAYECVHCGYNAKKEEEKKMREQQVKIKLEQMEQEQKRKIELKEQKKMRWKKNRKKIILSVSLAIIALVAIPAIGNIIYSKMSFNNAISCFEEGERYKGVDYLVASEKTWLNLNDYEMINQACFERANTYFSNKEYDKAREFFTMVDPESDYMPKIIDIYIRELESIQKWGQEAQNLYRDTGIMYERKKDITELESENKLKFEEKSLIYKEVGNGIIETKYIDKADNTEEFDWEDYQSSIIKRAKDYMQELQGAYQSKYYCIYVNGYDIYWGDETGVADYKEATSCKYVSSKDRIEVEGGWGETYISIVNENEITTDIWRYFRISTDELPSPFKTYISN